MTLKDFISKRRNKREPPSKLDILLDNLAMDVIKKALEEEPLIDKVTKRGGNIPIRFAKNEWMKKAGE